MKNNNQESKAPKNDAIQCGNCWGHQEYAEQEVNKQPDVQKDAEDGFIMKFVKKHL